MGQQSTVTASDAPLVRLGLRSVLAVGVLVTAAAALFAVTIVVPYYVNDLDALPLAEVAGGAHDPKDLWPRGAAAGWVQLAAFLAIGLTPLTALVGAALSGVVLLLRLRRGGPARVLVGSALVLALSVAVLVVRFSAFGSALVTWRMD